MSYSSTIAQHGYFVQAITRMQNETVGHLSKIIDQQLAIMFMNPTLRAIHQHLRELGYNFLTWDTMLQLSEKADNMTDKRITVWIDANGNLKARHFTGTPDKLTTKDDFTAPLEDPTSLTQLEQFIKECHGGPKEGKK